MRSPPPAGCDGDTSETMRTRSGSFTRASPERPEAVGMSLPAGQMLPLHAFHRLVVEEPSRSNAVARQQIVQRRPQLATQPVSERDHEALLAVREDLLGQDAREGGLQEPIQAAAGHLGLWRQAQALLDDPVV